MIKFPLDKPSTDLELDKDLVIRGPWFEEPAPLTAGPSDAPDFPDRLPPAA